MIKIFKSFVIIVILWSQIKHFKASEVNLSNFNNFETRMDVKTLAVAKLTRKCLLDKKRSLAVTDSLRDELIRYFHRSETTSITSFANWRLFAEESYSAALQRKELYCGQHYYRYLWKSKGFVISASSPVHLKDQIEKIKNSRWWNLAGFFLFIEERPILVGSCTNAYEFLSMAWKYGLLSSVFLCQEQDGYLSMYSYNPYTDSAPQPWVKVRDVKGQHGYPWYLFKWTKYDGQRYDCKTIFFDKTKSLSGYPILINAIPASPFLYFDSNVTGYKKYDGEDGWIMRVIWRFLNATIVEVPLHKDNAFLGWVDDNGTIHGNLIDIASGKVEIGMNSMILQPMWMLTPTYPHSTLNFCFVTNDRGAIPWLIGLVLIFDKWTMACAAMIFFVTTMIFGYVNDRRYISGFLNILRVYVSTSFIRPPASATLRIILGVVLLVPIVSYSTFQGKVLSMIQNPLQYKNIDTIEDLISAGYHLEGPNTAKDFISTKRVRDSYVINGLKHCLHKLYKKKHIGCMQYCFTLFVKASHEKKLYVAQTQTAHYQNRFIAKPDWPLVDRFNIIMQRLVATGLIKYYRTANMYRELQTSTMYAYDDVHDTAALVIHLKDFGYIFIGLGIGWICGILVFICELLTSRSITVRKIKNRSTRVVSLIRRYITSQLIRRRRV